MDEPGQSGKAEEFVMYNQVETWLNAILQQVVPAEIVGVNFNLYEDFEPGGEKSWSMELVGTGSFDKEDEDWACDEVCDFGTRETPFCWRENAEWDMILEKIVQILRKYMSEGLFAGKLKQCDGVGVGFVDGNIEILYVKQVNTR